MKRYVRPYLDRSAHGHHRLLGEGGNGGVMEDRVAPQAQSRRTVVEHPLGSDDAGHELAELWPPGDAAATSATCGLPG